MRLSARSCCSPTRCDAVTNGVRSRPKPGIQRVPTEAEVPSRANSSYSGVVLWRCACLLCPIAAVARSQAFRERRATQHPCTGIESLGGNGRRLPAPGLAADTARGRQRAGHGGHGTGHGEVASCPCVDKKVCWRRSGRRSGCIRHRRPHRSSL